MTPDQFQRVLATGHPEARAALIVAAMIGGLALMLRDARSWPLSTRQRVGLFAAIIGGGFGGALALSHLAGGLVGQQIRSGGPTPMTILGGLLAGFLSAALYKRWLVIRWDTSDAFARGTCLAMGIGRLGCHASHCCLGVPAVDPRWGVDFGDGCPRVPIQLVEAALVLALLPVLTALHERDALPHRRLFLLFAAYGTLRFFLEFWREPMGYHVLGLGSYQWFAAGLAGVGLYQIAKRTRALRREAAARRPA